VISLAMSIRYLAPEYAQYSMVSVRTDVYAFGIVLFQLISGKKVLDEYEGQCTHILQWVFFLWHVHLVNFISCTLET
jgi:serine/threonine protein kinase